MSYMDISESMIRVGSGAATCNMGVAISFCPIFINADDGIVCWSIIILIIIIDNLYAYFAGFKHIFCVGNTCPDIHLFAFDTSTHPLLFLYSPTRHQAPFFLTIGF